MKTQKERIEALHRRAKDLKLKKTKNSMAAWGGLSAALCAMLTICIMHTGRALHDTADINMQATSLLDNGAGGYVLTSVIAFAAGAVITIMIRKLIRKTNE